MMILKLLFLIGSIQLHADTVRFAEGGPPAGAGIPEFEFLDDSGRNRSFSEFSGTPVILVPMYTRCRSSCPTMIAGIKKALLGSRLDSSKFRVLMFSFDDSDGLEELKEFRETEKIPLAWSIGTARKENIRNLMESIGFRYATADGQFAHPNMLAFISPGRQIAKVLYGTRFDPSQIDDAIAIANGRFDWMEWAGPYFVSFSVVGLLMSSVYLAYLLTRRRGVAPR